MDLVRFSGFMLATTIILLVGCSKASELRTPAQSKTFIVSVTRGGQVDSWELSGKATDDAKRAWAERAAIADLGEKLRSEGKTWACEVAERSVFLRTSFGQFTVGDRVGLTNTARVLGAKVPPIKMLLSDVLKLSVSDLETARAAVCPTY